MEPPSSLVHVPTQTSSGHLHSLAFGPSRPVVPMAGSNDVDRRQEMLKPKLHNALSMVAPIDIDPCLLGDEPPQMDEARRLVGWVGS